MTNTIDKGVPLMKPTFFDDNDPNNPKRKTYIEREALLDNFYIYKLASASNYKHFADLVKNAPSADVVSSAVLEQVMWERDMALKTLKDHGIGFCEKSDMVEVRHSEWKQVVFDDGAKSCKCCMACGMFVEPKYNYKYCPGCGAKMDGRRRYDD